jgi:hypothetical protein
MADDSGKLVGAVSWLDLTVSNAPEIRDFYVSVVGWTAEGLNMGGYEDFCMNLSGSSGSTRATVAGICHARGPNADLPPQWLAYVNVRDLDESLAQCRKLGGKEIGPVRKMGSEARYCVIQDPAGAVLALVEHAQGPAPLGTPNQ